MARVHDYVEQVVEGFRTAYQIVLRHRQELLSPTGPLSRFRDLPRRYDLRPTQAYADLMLQSSAPDHLASGAAYDVALDMLAGDPPPQGIGPSHLDDEKQCLWQQDIPVYYGNTTDLRLRSSSGAVHEGVFAQTSYSRMSQQLQTLSREDLMRQEQLIRDALPTPLPPHGRPQVPAAARDVAHGEWVEV